MKTIKRLHLCESIRAKIDIPPALGQKIVDAAIDQIIQGLESEGSVKISNFGTFKTLQKTSRPGRNPKTGESVTVTGRVSVSFSPSSTLKESVKKKLSV